MNNTINKRPIHLKPITTLLMTIGELPSSYLMSMTYEEQLLWLLNYLEKTVLPTVNSQNDAIKELQELYILLEKYVNDYFDNLDVQEEINIKINQMQEDGSLAEIINEQIFNELNDKVDNLQETFDNSIKKIFYNNIFLGVFFDNNERLHFMTSLDGQNWSEFNKSISISGRDPQLIYNKNNKTFYLTLTQSSGVAYDFITYTSTDFINWTQRQVDIGLHSGTRWSPELFIDEDGTMYATISKGESNDAMQIYIAECNDIENLTFNNARVLNLQLNNVIDASLTKYNGLYYLTVKNEDTAKQYIYTSPNLITFTQINTDIIGYNVPCEGGQLLNINDRWYFYGDTWQSYKNYGLMQTDDLNNFGFLLINNSLKGMRHGSVCYLNDKEAVNLITSLEDYSNITKTEITESQIILEGTYDNLVVYPNIFYRISGSGATINKLENPYNLQFMPFTFTAGSSATFTVTFKNNKTKTIYNSSVENEKLQIISLQGDQYMTGNVKKNISADDLWTINDTSQYTVTLYSAIQTGNTLNLVFAVTKLVNTTNVYPFTLKSPYRPITTTALNNDKGLNTFIRADGTTNMGNILQTNVYTYCYCSLIIA